MGSQRVGHDRVTKSFTFRSSKERCGWNSGPDTGASVGAGLPAPLTDPPREFLLRLGPAHSGHVAHFNQYSGAQGELRQLWAKPCLKAYSHFVEP